MIHIKHRISITACIAPPCVMEWGRTECRYWCCFICRKKSKCIYETRECNTCQRPKKKNRILRANGIVHMAAEGEIFKNVCICPSHRNAHTFTIALSQSEIIVNIDMGPDLSRSRSFFLKPLERASEKGEWNKKKRRRRNNNQHIRTYFMEMRWISTFPCVCFSFISIRLLRHFYRSIK